MVADKALNVIERVVEKDADFVRKRLNILLFEGAHQCTGPIDVDQRMLAAAP